MLQTLIDIIHIGACLILMFVVLLQQGKGGGMGAAFGSGGAAQVFGGRGAGNVLTRATSICAGIFMITSVSLAYLSSSRDRSLEKAAAAHQQKMSTQGTPRSKDEKPADKKDDLKDTSPSQDTKGDDKKGDDKTPDAPKP